MIQYYIKVGAGEEKDILATYGVHVSGSTGLVGKPEYKESRKYSWDYLNGEWVDLATRRYKPREITMKCWISSRGGLGTNPESLAVTALNNFLKVFDTDNLVRLRVVFGNQGLTNELFFLVYLKGSTTRYKWNRAKQVIEFDLHLVETSPEKKIFERTFTGSTRTATASYTSASEFDIDWGDGTVTYDLVGTAMTLTHTYASAGTYIIIASGVLKDMTVTISGTQQSEQEEER